MATVRAEQLVMPDPEVASALSNAVEKFARRHGLHWQAWHQDDPVWQIWHEEVIGSKTIRRILQVSAYASPGGAPVLKAIGLGQIIDEAALLGKVLKPPRLMDQKMLAQIKDVSTIMAFLDNAWPRVMEIREDDFPVETINLPPRPAKWPP